MNFCIVTSVFGHFPFLLWLTESVRPRGRPKRTWKEVVEGDMKSLKLRKEDALVRGKWRRLNTMEDSDDSGD